MRPDLGVPAHEAADGRSKSRLPRLLLFGLALAVVIAVGVWLMGAGNLSLGQKTPATGSQPSGDKKSSARLTEVQVVTPVRRDVVATLRLYATVSPYHQTTLYSKVSGYLKAIHVDKGDLVKAGQVLAVIDDPELRQRYEQAQSEYAIKKVTYERLANVKKENPDVIAKQDVDVAEANYQSAKHALDQVASMLDYTKVRAPYKGIITARFVDPGALIQAATSSATQAVPLFTVMDISILRFYINIPQEDAAFVKAGTTAVISLKDTGKTLQATVTRSTQVLDPVTRTMLVEIDLPNPGHDLTPGMFAEVILDLRRHPNALVLPPSAFVADKSGKAVFVITDGFARKVPVKTDIDDGVWVEVASGLNGNEDVVVTGKSALTDGLRVKTSPYNLPAGQPASQKF
jgi:membrane fusion protein, multidrug efflux system